MRDRYESGDSVTFTITSSVAPDSAWSLAIVGPNSTGPLVSSVTTVGSNTTWQAAITMPASADGIYRAELRGERTVNGDTLPVIRRWNFVVATTPVR